MGQRNLIPLWALGILSFATPAQAIVIHVVPTCVLCGSVPGIAGGEADSFSLEASLTGAVFALSTSGAGMVDIDDVATSLPVRIFGGTLVEEAGVVVPSNRHASSALPGSIFENAACEDCAATATDVRSSARLGFGVPLLAILSALLIAIALPLFYLVRYLRSLDSEEAYLKQRWGVRSKME